MDGIVFTTDVRKELHEELKPYGEENVFVLTDKNTCKYCLPLLELQMMLPGHVIVLDPGESYKSLESVAKIWTVLSEKGAKRSSVLVNVGGGLVTDIGGFAASCFKRGIRCINVPTTLLAQVDASVGGKTGINFNGLKNEIGTFSVPRQVIIDARFLKTLPRRQILSGFAEMLKHGLLSGKEHFSKILALGTGIITGENFLGLLEESVAVKARIVEEDPTEKGVRKALNFGHTIGHALESVAIKEKMEVYHGDAVAMGMIAELWLSVMKKGFDRALYERVRAFILNLYPVDFPVVSLEQLYELMLHDKKNEKSGVNFTLLEGPGYFTIDNYCSRSEILTALKTLPFFD